MKVLVIEDEPGKYRDISRALERSGISKNDRAKNQKDGFELIYKSIKDSSPYDVVVTDMQYPLEQGASIDKEAGFKLLQRFKKENINIPVIICSQSNYSEPEAFGTVWYDDRCDIDAAFRELINKLR